MKKSKRPKHHLAKMRALQPNPGRTDHIMCFEHIRQYHEAVLFGASERGVTLPSTYHIDMKKFLDNYKKEIA